MSVFYDWVLIISSLSSGLKGKDKAYKSGSYLYALHSIVCVSDVFSRY